MKIDNPTIKNEGVNSQLGDIHIRADETSARRYLLEKWSYLFYYTFSGNSVKFSDGGGKLYNYYEDDKWYTEFGYHPTIKEIYYSTEETLFEIGNGDYLVINSSGDTIKTF